MEKEKKTRTENDMRNQRIGKENAAAKSRFHRHTAACIRLDGGDAQAATLVNSKALYYICCYIVMISDMNAFGIHPVFIYFFPFELFEWLCVREGGLKGMMRPTADC